MNVKKVKITWREYADKETTGTAVLMVHRPKKVQPSKEEHDEEEVLCYEKTQQEMINLYESSKDDDAQPYMLFTESWCNDYCTRVRFDIKHVIRDLVGLKNTSKKKKNTNVFSMQQEKDHATGKFQYTATIRSKSIFLSSTSQSLFMKGFIKYITKRSFWQNQPLAFYDNALDAQKAIAIKTMVHFKRSILNASIVSEEIKKKRALSKPIALFQNIHGEEPVFFGMLQTPKKNQKPALYVPIDEDSDIYVPWQRFEFKEY